MLVVFGGLPGTGKTTIAREVARLTSALYVRIDTIEQSIRRAGKVPGIAARIAAEATIGIEGYAVAMALTRENLAIGQTVIADAVNSTAEARQAWRAIATDTTVPCLEIEIVCSDLEEHRRRIEARTADIDGLTLPSWDDVITRDYATWNEDHWIIDTGVLRPDAAVTAVCERMRAVHATTAQT